MSKDNPNQLGNLSKNEMAMIVVGVVLVLIVATYAATVIIGVWNGKDNIVVTGTIDLGLFQGVVFSIAGAGILMLGITQGQKIAAVVSSGLRSPNGNWARTNMAKQLNQMIQFYADDIVRSEKLLAKFNSMKEQYPTLKDNFSEEIDAVSKDIVDAQKQMAEAIAEKKRVMNDQAWNN